MLRKHQQLKEELKAIRRILDGMLENEADTWSRINSNKARLATLKEEIDKVNEFLVDIDEAQALQTYAIDELRENVKLILDHLGVEVVQPSDKPTLKKKK